MEYHWMKRDAFAVYCREHPVDPLLRLLLTSDGTVVRHLSALFSGPISLEVQDQREIVINDEMSEWLEIVKGEKGIERRVWLTDAPPEEGKNGLHARGLKRLYAISTFPISRLKPDLYREIELGLKPLGQIIEERRLPARRDRLEIGQRLCPEAAKAFGLPQDELFWARRYRLTISEQASGAIFELFSPRLFSSRS